jgi:hypothetical protein
MAKLNQLILLENMMKTYDAMNLKDANLTHFQGVCTEKLVDNINGRLERLVVSKVRMSCRNVLLANYETMTKTTYWLGCRLFSDLPQGESRVQREKVEQMVELLNELVLKIVNVDEEYAKRFFERIKMAYHQKSRTDFELWIARQSHLTIERLKEYQAELTADMLIMGILKYDDMPSGKELKEVDMEKLREHLRKDKELPEDFGLECAKLRRYSHWEGDMFFIDYEKLRKPLFQHFGELTHEQHIAMFEYDVQMKQIHEEMRKISNQQKSEYYSIFKSEKAMKYWKRLMELGLVDNNCQLRPETSRQQAMYIVEPFAEKLGLKKLWKPFEDFWGIKNLAQEKWRFQQTAVLPPIHKEIDNVFRD